MYWRGGGIGHSTPHRAGAFAVSETLYTDAGVQPSDLSEDIVIEDEVPDEMNDVDMQFIGSVHYRMVSLFKSVMVS